MKKNPKVAYICVCTMSSNPLFSLSKNSFAKFEILTDVSMKIQLLRDVMFCRPVNSKLQ